MSVAPPESRYLNDLLYARAFFAELSPAWLDFAGLLWGLKPVQREAGFTWCDLGCGQGLNAVVLAATHPAGQFHGVDFIAGHIDHARSLAAAAGAHNAAFHLSDFGVAVDLDLPQFDYITAHGVYSWVDDRAREDLRRFLERRLKPGGRFYVSYNALPGRSPDLPFQRLIWELGRRFPGDSGQQVRAATRFASLLLANGVPALTASPMANIMLKRGLDEAFLAHELMISNWRPLSVIDVARDMAAIGLEPAGSANLIENFDDFVLDKAARKILAQASDPDLRLLVRDYLLNQSFRRDVFVRGAAVMTEADRRRRLLDFPFALSMPKAKVRYSFGTAAGEVRFDNPIARKIVGFLAHGPGCLRDLLCAEASAGDLLANAMILAGAQIIWPVEAARRSGAEAFNRAVMDRLGTPEALHMLALGCGTAIDVSPDLMAALRDDRGGVRSATAAWRRHFSAYGAIAA